MREGLRRRLTFIAGMPLLGVAGCGADPGGAAEQALPLRVCPSSAVTFGVDVSKYQRTVHWDRVAAAGVRFAFARISDGLSHEDPEFDSNWRGMRDAGLVRGAYQFFEPGEDPAAQAALVVARVGRLADGDLPVAIDVEVDGGLPPDAIARAVLAWIVAVTEGTGKNPVLYTARYFWDGSVATDTFATQPLWVASYGASCPDIPGSWEDFRFWQYSSAGTIAGISGPVDLDRFNGDADALARFASTAPGARSGCGPPAPP